MNEVIAIAIAVVGLVSIAFGVVFRYSSMLEMLEEEERRANRHE